LTHGNNPSTGSDRQGLTALINSLCKLDTHQIGGQTCYLKFGPSLLTDDRLTTDALLKTFFAQGGSNCMITVTSNEELREALVHPERHRSLIVRVGGFSARFVELSRDLQEEILARTVC
jgi:pyruvate-formate lyase